ncbi:MAG: formyltetrahydrofolate deformylase [Actinomycetales bacterium]
MRPDLEVDEPAHPTPEFVLTLACDDRPGIVHAATAFLVAVGGNILESAQFNDRLTNRFFLRVHFETPGQEHAVDDLRARFEAVSQEYSMEFELWDARARYRALIMVSKHLHCLNDLLFRWSVGALNIDIPVVVSNHPDAEALVRSYGLDFALIPVTAQTKQAAEQQLLDLVDEHGIDVVVLARYMQVLSDTLCERMSGRIINIHHSFLPSFKGAKPYHQAHDRGVKLIGATAHYVTADLDEGPIIEQDVERVSHAYTQDQLVAVGRDVEAQVLSRALRWHCETRVLMNGHRTVVFN